MTFYTAMAGAAFIIELAFGLLGPIPREHNARVVEASVTWNYTTWLNIAFIALGAALTWRFFTKGGLNMLRMMNRPHQEWQAHS